MTMTHTIVSRSRDVRVKRARETKASNQRSEVSQNKEALKSGSRSF